MYRYVYPVPVQILVKSGKPQAHPAINYQIKIDSHPFPCKVFIFPPVVRIESSARVWKNGVTGGATPRPLH